MSGTFVTASAYTYFLEWGLCGTCKERFLVIFFNFRTALLLNDFLLNVNNRIVQEEEFLNYNEINPVNKR